MSKRIPDGEYNITPEEAIVLKRVIGIQDDEELKQHLLQVRSEAYAVQPYVCINRFEFARLRIVKHPVYQHALKVGQERKNAIFLELPCCVGGDSRMAVADGYPRDNLIVSDILAEFWDIGHKLFKTTLETYPVPFLRGDIFDPEFLKPGMPALSSASDIYESPPPLGSLTSLTPLQHHVSVIYSSLFFHLFDKDKQHQLVHLFVSLLSPIPGSVIFGYHIGASDAEEDILGRVRLTTSGRPAYAHSPTSWKEIWTGKDAPYKPEQVLIEVEVSQTRRAEKIGGFQDTYRGFFHTWSVMRI